MSFKVYAYDFKNPPSISLSCDVDLILINKGGNLELTKGQKGTLTEYTFSVLNPSNLGFLNYEEMTRITSLHNLILACNLVLRRVALSGVKLEIPKPLVSLLPIEEDLSTEKSIEGMSIKIRDTIPIRSEIYCEVQTKEDLDEQKVQKMAGQLQKLKLDVNSDLFKADLMNALFEYEAAMTPLNRLVIFKHLYNSLEIITNIDGKHRKGKDLDSEMSRITGVTIDDCSRWRNFYNRMKHNYRNYEEVIEYVYGTKKIQEDIPKMRVILAKLLIENLNSL
ncbi:MAG: hypothetical protein QW046_03430 [Candidatus Micrarchaeaceae archaeon]